MFVPEILSDIAGELVALTTVMRTEGDGDGVGCEWPCECTRCGGGIMVDGDGSGRTVASDRKSSEGMLISAIGHHEVTAAVFRSDPV